MANAMKGIIAMWSGTEANIPFGWTLCDGTNGTPDLRGRFIVCATTGTPPHTTGGSIDHNHTASQPEHLHYIESGTDIAAGPDFNAYTQNTQPTVDVDTSLHLPPFYALCFIMHI